MILIEGGYYVKSTSYFILLRGGGHLHDLNSQSFQSNICDQSKVSNFPQYLKLSTICAMIVFSSSAYAYTCNGNQCTIGTESGVTINSSNTPSNANVEIQQGATVTGTAGGGTVTINQNTTINEVVNKGTIQGGRRGINTDNATITTIDNQGTISTSGDDGISNRNRSNIGTINNQNNATISARWAIHNSSGNTITTINNSGKITGTSSGIDNSGTIITLNKDNGGIINSISNQRTITNLSNSGEITRIDNNNNGGYINNFTNETSGKIETLTNQGTIDNFENKGKIERVESTNGTINNQITNTGTISDIMLRVANQIINSGTISSLDVDSIQNGITNSGNINALTAESINNGVTNQGTIQTLTSTSAISGGITNSGTIGNLNNNQGTIDTLTNSGAISHLTNTGTLAGGIVNQNGGTMILASTGNIGLTNDDLHIKNENNTLKAITIENVSPTRFNKLKVDAGAKGGIFIKQITAQVEREGLTLEDLIEEQGVSFGSNCQNENCIIGLDENGNESEFSVFVRNSSVILNDFYAKRGQAASLTLDTSALSGSKVSQSLITNSRLRDIRINSILKEFSIKNFQTNFENSKESNLESLESYNLGKSEKYASLTQDMILSENAESTAQIWSDEDLLRELDDIFIANKSGREYYTFIAPYFSYDSSDIGGGDIKGHTRGFLAGIQTPLKNDAGIVGGFFGYERADKGLSSPSFNGGLDINDTSFLMGVSYYNVLHRKGLVEYYLSGNAKLGRSQYKII